MSSIFWKPPLPAYLRLCPPPVLVGTLVIELEPNVDPVPPHFGQSPFSHQYLDQVLAIVQDVKDRITAVISSSKGFLPTDVSPPSLLSGPSIEGSKEVEFRKKHGLEDHGVSSIAKKPQSHTKKPQLQAQVAQQAHPKHTQKAIACAQGL
ncbi:hypothetical protein PAXRUDRAFT_13974 [Paxillus rubicundulus Ve08.2h10]|uniref:Uncharacterized protein n=1 Tax=Paxillus rubicundulus Ve08.2h10 TaxID=930991 RepID=A0A0D0E2M7_9AGAM|nr:hypothetical protein PAXRUDRAFT_13974 [Paxillus rubicundulus Ve08.2h10]